MSKLHVLDTKMHGRAGITASYLITDGGGALIETGPKSSVDNVVAGLEERGIDSLEWIIVTHIHLDHAGAAGTLAQRFPDARIGVHEIGAPHLVDPSKLWSSAARIYGDRMDEMWGGIDPIPQDRIHVIRDGEVIVLGGTKLRAVETPGHAYHHHAFLDEGTGAVFSGDALGIRLPDLGVIRPAAPPPEFHLEKTIVSIERIRNLRPARLFPTHFGAHDEGNVPLSVDDFCDESMAAFRKWGEWVREARVHTHELDDATDLVMKQARSESEAGLSEEQVARLDDTSSYWMNTWGYMRYLDKAEAAGAQAPS